MEHDRVSASSSRHHHHQGDPTRVSAAKDNFWKMRGMTLSRACMTKPLLTVQDVTSAAYPLPSLLFPVARRPLSIQPVQTLMDHAHWQTLDDIRYLLVHHVRLLTRLLGIVRG